METSCLQHHVAAYHETIGTANLLLIDGGNCYGVDPDPTLLRQRHDRCAGVRWQHRQMVLRTPMDLAASTDQGGGIQCNLAAAHATADHHDVATLTSPDQRFAAATGMIQSDERLGLDGLILRTGDRGHCGSTADIDRQHVIGQASAILMDHVLGCVIYNLHVSWNERCTDASAECGDIDAVCADRIRTTQDAGRHT